MPTATLTLSTAYEVTEQFAPRIISSQFKNGLEIRVRDGLINLAPKSWAVTRQGMTDAAATNLDAFLSTQKGLSFHWSATGISVASTDFYQCKDWQFTIQGPNTQDFQATFKQIFRLTT